MGDLLSAASLLVAVVGLLYGVWYPEINSAQQINVDRLIAQDSKQQRQQIESALKGRATPLAAAAWLLVLVLLKDAVGIATEAFTALLQTTSTPLVYDAVKACVVLVEVFALFLAITLTTSVCHLVRSRQKLTPPR